MLENVFLSAACNLLTSKIPVRTIATVACLLSVGLWFAVPAGAQELRFEVDLQSTGQLQLIGQDARAQLVVNQVNADDLRDVTRLVTYRVEPSIATIDATGYVRPLENGTATIVAQLENATAAIPLQISGMEEYQPVNFPHQVVPIFTKFGCNGGGCHGKAAGQAGFKLSLLGFEPREDFEHLVNESRGRRVFPAAPAQSLLLQKAVNQSPHGGGKRLDVDSHEYRVLERWIATGMPYGGDNDPVVTQIAIHPAGRRLPRLSTQQLSVVATYSDGHTEDITRTAQFESNNKDLAEVDERGWVQLKDQPGEVAVMARYQGQVAVFRASIPLGIPLAVDTPWPPARNLVDEHVYAKLRTLGIPPSQLCDDATFVRRITLDIAGRLPTIEETRAFVDSQDSDKHARAVDRLLESPDYAVHFAKKWTMILRNRRDGAGEQFGSFAFHHWLRGSFLENKPYDQIVRELLTATGSAETNPAVVWLREVSNTESRVEDMAQLFLGQRIQCARCHHHPFEKWSQTDYFRLSAFFSKVGTKEGATPEEPIYVSTLGAPSAQHPKSGEQLAPAGLDAEPLTLDGVSDPRAALVDWMVANDNRFFARSLTNRYWKHFFGQGLVEPEDDVRVTNPATNEELLNGLSEHFVESGYDLKQLVRLICISSVYRLSSDANEHNLGDQHCFSRYYPKRLTAEVLLDTLDQVCMTESSFGGMPAGTRAVELPDTGFDSYFLDVFGRPSGTTACECERSQEATLAQSLHLLNSKDVQAKLLVNTGRVAALAASSEPIDALIEQLYMAAFSRPPTPEEQQTASDYVTARADNRRAAFEDLVWAIVNSKEFLFNH